MLLKRHKVEALQPSSGGRTDSGALVSAITSKLLELVAAEISKADMQRSINVSVVTPLLNMVYVQLYPYIIAGVAVVLLMFLLLVGLLASFLLYLRPRAA